MAVHYAQSFFETTLAQSITATQTTIQLTTAPTVTSGYLVIEYNSSNREIIYYSGVTGTTLTGVVRGLELSGYDDSTGTLGKPHPSGVSIAMKDCHYYLNKVVAAYRGDTASGYNTFDIGDGGAVSTANRFWQVRTSSVSAFWGLSSNGQMVVSEDGVNSYVISAGGSGLAAGVGIDITAGVIDAYLLSTGGIIVSGNGLAVGQSDDTIGRSSAGIYVDTSADFLFSGDVDIYTLSLSTTQLSTTAAELNQLSGISASVYANNLNTLTDNSDAAGLHYHAIATSSYLLALSATEMVYCPHNLGVIPSYIKLTGYGAEGGTNVSTSWCTGVSGGDCIRYQGHSGGSVTSINYPFYLNTGVGKGNYAYVMSATSASFYIGHTVAGAPGGYMSVMWEAHA